MDSATHASLGHNLINYTLFYFKYTLIAAGLLLSMLSALKWRLLQKKALVTSQQRQKTLLQILSGLLLFILPWHWQVTPPNTPSPADYQGTLMQHMETTSIPQAIPEPLSKLEKAHRERIATIPVAGKKRFQSSEQEVMRAKHVASKSAIAPLQDSDSDHTVLDAIKRWCRFLLGF